MAAPAFDPARRRFLTGRGPGIPPPWADAARLHTLCTGCSTCVDACPEGILVAGAAGVPEVEFQRGECTFCQACADACPEPIFASRERQPWDLRAAIGDACLTLRGVVCQSCRDTCASGAIRFTPALRSAPRPTVETDQCTGCGACIAGCPVQAITVAAHG
jgi:ferredoxin-type protein NapF